MLRAAAWPRSQHCWALLLQSLHGVCTVTVRPLFPWNLTPRRDCKVSERGAAPRAGPQGERGSHSQVGLHLSGFKRNTVPPTSPGWVLSSLTPQAVLPQEGLLEQSFLKKSLFPLFLISIPITTLHCLHSTCLTFCLPSHRLPSRQACKFYESKGHLCLLDYCLPGLRTGSGIQTVLNKCAEGMTARSFFESDSKYFLLFNPQSFRLEVMFNSPDSLLYLAGGR